MESKVIQVQIIFVLNCDPGECGVWSVGGVGKGRFVQKVPSSKNSLESKIMGQMYEYVPEKAES